MKNIYLKTLAKFGEVPGIKFVDKDRGQLDHYEQRPSVKFPCALVTVSAPKRKNLASDIQMCNAQISIRLAFERVGDTSSISGAGRLSLALNFYDTVELIEALFQGFTDAEMNPWECTSVVEEMRSDFEVVRLTFTTSYTKEF